MNFSKSNKDYAHTKNNSKNQQKYKVKEMQKYNIPLYFKPKPNHLIFILKNMCWSNNLYNVTQRK